MPLAPCDVFSLRESLSRIPRLPWNRIFLLAAAFFACLVLGFETYSRAQGFRPTVSETLGLWYYWRRQVYPPDGKVIVLAGTSRVSADISLATMRECLPEYRVVQLGILGPVSCIGLLRDLVDDPAFRGIAICELDAPLLERTEWDGHRDFRNYRPPTIASLVDVVIKSWLQDRLALLADRLTLGKLLAARFNAAPVAHPVTIRRTFSREVQWDFGVARDDALRKQAMNPPAADHARRPGRTWPTITKDATDVAALVQRLRARGGDVVFLRAPSTGLRWIREEELHPKIGNWDRFARMASAVCIHFQDAPEMRALNAPDGSHLDYRDSPQFTRALVARLTFFPTREGSM
jgi:hypothetical protein